MFEIEMFTDLSHLLILQIQFRSPMTSSDAETDFKPLLLLFT